MNWKGELIEFLTFVVAPVLGASGVVLALRLSSIGRWDARQFARRAAGLFLLTRAGTHVVVFHVFRYAGSDDLLRVWAPMGRAVLGGGDPGRYADNLYGPLLPFVMALGLVPSGGGYAPGIDLPLVAADALSLVLLLRIARRRLDETSARRFVLATMLSPLVWLGVSAFTQEESLFAFFLIWTLDLAERGKTAGAAAAAALGTLATKALFPFFVLPVLVAAGGGRRAAFVRVGSAALLTAAGIGAALSLSWEPPRRVEESPFAFGSTTWLLFLADGTLPVRTHAIGVAATALICCAAGLVAARSRPGESTTDAAARGVVAVQAAFLVASPFAVPPHLVHGLAFLAWQLVREGAGAPRPPFAALLLLAGFAAWQVPSLGVGAASWPEYPLMLAAFAAFWAWTGWRAIRARWAPCGDAP